MPTSSDTVIAVDRLSKRYTIRHETGSGDGFRHAIQDAVTAPFRWLQANSKSKSPGQASSLVPKRAKVEDFWALRDVSFEVGRGEVMGIIGRNGAGKSTLLKVLSRITDPSDGRVNIRGRVASLLEVGTGFHPELTGRENIFVNGAILGMTRRDINRRFDEIVAFAEVEQFLDTPVKRYSSGMYVRLAFAVAAHLEPEILIVDEVLAVGDIAFQRKCLGKMRSVSVTDGRTVLFVSHDLSAITSLTSRCVLLDKGRVASLGLTGDVVNTYFAMVGDRSGYAATPGQRDAATIAAVRVRTSEAGGVQAAGQAMDIEVDIDHVHPVKGACLSLVIVNQYGHPATHVWIYSADRPFADVSGRTTLRCHVPKVRLNVGRYTLKLYFSEPPGGKFFDVLEGLCPFEVVRLGASVLWGWRPDACVYHEEADWSLSAGPSTEAPEETGPRQKASGVPS